LLHCEWKLEEQYLSLWACLSFTLSPSQSFSL
jgi:hypothetical protein